MGEKQHVSPSLLDSLLIGGCELRLSTEAGSVAPTKARKASSDDDQRCRYCHAARR